MCAATEEYNSEFWARLEKEMKQTLPEVVKNVLARTGYERELCLRNVAAGDIAVIESFIEKNKSKLLRKYSKTYKQYSIKDSFKLLPGHSKTISIISNHCEANFDAASGSPKDFIEKNSDGQKSHAQSENVSCSVSLF